MATQQQVQQPQKRQSKSHLKRRLIIAVVIVALIVSMVWILGSLALIPGIWATIVSTLVTVFGVVFAFLPLISSSDKPEASALPLARELVRESASFRMGDTTAANFDYITAPIKHAYDTARQALHDASVGAGSKRGILIFGLANAGKTRLAFEALTQTLPDWNVLLWNATYDTLSKVPVPTVSRGSDLVVFIDDLQEYVLAEGSDADRLGFLSDTRIATLQAFLHTMQTAKHLVVVATCRLEDETRVGARLRWLFDQLKVIKLRSFRVEVTDPESATIIDLFRQHNAINVEDWDGTLGSLVLGLSKKQSQYEQLVHSHHPAVAVLRTMKLLSLAGISVHTSSRIQGVCAGVFGESILQEGAKTWQESVDHLTRVEFVTEVKDKASGNYALVIRKDTYFDKIIKDYPASNRPHQLEQHFEQLQKVLVELNDSSALVSLGNTYLDLKRYEEALAALEQALRLDPNEAPAYIGRGGVLLNLKRYEEALAAFDQAIRLDPNGAPAYTVKGIALGELKRYEEALAAFDQAIRFDPTFAFVYNDKGAVLLNLQRYEEALAAFDQTIRFDPNDVLAYTAKGIALRNLKRYEEALAAYEQALRLDPTDTDAYNSKEKLLRMLEHEGDT